MSTSRADVTEGVAEGPTLGAVRCRHCNSLDLRGDRRRWHEKLRGAPAQLRCAQCGGRTRVSIPKFCRCGSDLDRRARREARDFLWAVAGLRPYSCRRCGKRRYRR